MQIIHKKFLFVLSIASFLLSACGAGQISGSTITPSATPTFAPTSTLSPIESPTPTVTSTPTPEPVWSPDYAIKTKDTKEITVRDVLPDTKNEFSHIKLFNLELITDESFYCESGQGGKYQSAGYNSFSTYTGRTGYRSDEAYQAVAKVIMWAFFESAIRAGYEPQQVVTAENKYDAVTQFVRDMVDGKQVEIQAVLPATAKEFKLQTKTLGLPETIRVIFVNATNYKWKNLPRNDGSSIAWGMYIAPEYKFLELYIGGDKSLYYVHSYNLSNRFAFSTWKSFGLNEKQAPFDLVSRGNQFVANGGLTGALDCKP